jgi:hypothetical protein
MYMALSEGTYYEIPYHSHEGVRTGFLEADCTVTAGLHSQSTSLSTVVRHSLAAVAKLMVPLCIIEA